LVPVIAPREARSTETTLEGGYAGGKVPDDYGAVTLP